MDLCLSVMVDLLDQELCTERPVSRDSGGRTAYVRSRSPDRRAHAKDEGESPRACRVGHARQLALNRLAQIADLLHEATCQRAPQILRGIDGDVAGDPDRDQSASISAYLPAGEMLPLMP